MKGKLTNSKPCIMCAQIIKSVGIRRVYYSNDEGSLSVLNIKDMILKDHKIPKSMERFYESTNIVCRFKYE